MLQGSGRSPRKRRRRCGRQAAIARAFAGIKTMQLIEQLNPSFFSALHSSISAFDGAADERRE